MYKKGASYSLEMKILTSNGEVGPIFRLVDSTLNTTGVYYESKKPIFYLCLEKYESKELDSLIRTFEDVRENQSQKKKLKK